MTCGRIVLLCTGAVVALGTAAASAHDWPEWCGQPSRNMAAHSDRRLPDWADCGVEDRAGEVDLRSTRNVKWVAKLGHRTTGSPVVSGGRVFIGTTWEQGREPCFLCLDEQTGKLLGTFLCPQPQRENLENWAISSTPTVDGDRLYFVSPYQEVICVDLKVLLGADRARERVPTPRSAKPDKSALEQLSQRSIAWRYDLLGKLAAYYHHTASSSVLVHGDYVYVCTGNGRSWVPGRIPFSPLTPSLVVFHKRTGELVARDDEQIGERLYRGQYTSPALGTVNGRTQILFATGDGVCYAFEPVDPSARVVPDRWMTTRLRGPIVYFIDVEGLDTRELMPAEYARSASLLSTLPKPALPLEFRFSRKVPAVTPVDSIPTAQVPDVPLLRKVWWCDCIPSEYMRQPFYPREIKGDGRGHPCDIIGTPVSHNNRVYLAIGGDPNHGGRDSKGSLVCIDATGTGDLTAKGKLWTFNELNQSISTLAVTDGLVFVADATHTLYCLDAESGRCYWKHPTRRGATCFSSPLVADGKVYLGKAIVSASKTLQLHAGINSDRDTHYSSHSVANGVVYAVIGEHLWALCDKGDRPPAKPHVAAAAARPAVEQERPGKVRAAQPPTVASTPAKDALLCNWPSLRGPLGQGVAYHVAPPIDFDVASGKNVRWKTPIPLPGASSPVVWEGRVFLTGADPTTRAVYCFDAASGKPLWRHTDRQPANVPKSSEEYGYAASTGATDGKHFFAIFSTGDIVALDMQGSVAWRRALGVPKSAYGYASSLMAYKHLFVQVDDSASAILYALDPATGQTVWQKQRSVRESWASPIIAQAGDRELVVLAENPTASAYDLHTGAAVFSTKCLAGEVTPSPACARGTLIVANESAKLSAITLASGAIAWSAEDDLPNTASPLATDAFVFTADASGMVSCYDLGTGNKLWTHEFEQAFYPSPILAAGRIYALDNGGTLHVFQAAKTFVKLADVKLGEETVATPAFAGDTLLLRGKTHLYCIGAK